MEIKKLGLRVCPDRLPVARVKLRLLCFGLKKIRKLRSCLAKISTSTVSYLAFVNREIEDNYSIIANECILLFILRVAPICVNIFLRKKVVEKLHQLLYCTFHCRSPIEIVIPGRNDLSITRTARLARRLINETHLKLINSVSTSRIYSYRFAFHRRWYCNIYSYVTRTSNIL